MAKKKKPGMRSAKEKSALAKTLAWLRDKLGEITQEEAARRLGVSTHTWVSWENDQRKPSATAIALLKITFPEVAKKI